MGPQHDSCGRLARLVAQRVGALPSMGPQHDSCGRLSCRVWVTRSQNLQWGRNMIVAEGKILFSRTRRVNSLQWGRNMIVAEGD